MPVINAVFTPDAERIAYARKVIAAFETAPDGLVMIDGKLIEIPVVRSASGDWQGRPQWPSNARDSYARWNRPGC
jgi:hypothetical protein